MNSKPTPPAKRSIFAIGETFMAIGVMCLIASLVVPLLAMSGGFQEVQEKRNAQLLASVCFQAQQAGIDFVAQNGVDPTVQNLLAGGQTSEGRHFQAMGLSQTDASAAAKHLRINDGNLIYSPSGF
jgi:type II secretory pathway pseudopilin PulG